MDSCTLKGTVGCDAAFGTWVDLSLSSVPLVPYLAAAPLPLLPLPRTDGASPTHTQ